MSQTQLSPSESLQEQDPKHGPKTKTRRPPNTAFRQQRLKAWQPILTPKTVLPLLFIIGIVFAPIGGLLLFASHKVQEINLDYSGCHRLEQGLDEVPMPASKVTAYFTGDSSAFKSRPPTWKSSVIRVPIGKSGQRTYTTTQCSITFEVPHDLKAPIYLYYKLTNFYQNHRRYVQSSQQQQLEGKAPKPAEKKLANCSPLDRVDGKPYYPCGLIANSQFNDTIGEPVLQNTRGDNADSAKYEMSMKGTAWSSDAELYVTSENTGYKNDEVVPPPHWAVRYPENYTDEFPQPDLKHDEAFQNWMRTAGLPTFSKLYRRNDTTPMPRGRYQINITDDFPTEMYGGTKSLVLTTRTVMGGRNPFLGIAYIVVGGVCVILGAIFTVAHLIKPRKLGDHNYLSWNNDKPSTATTTGRSGRPNEA